MNELILTYLLYLLITTVLTGWAGRTFFRNGRIFLIDIFHGNTELAEAVNKLLLAGFCLINTGYAVYILKISGTITTVQGMIEHLSEKTGLIMLILGAMHFLNLLLLFRFRRRAVNTIMHPHNRPMPNAE